MSRRSPVVLAATAIAIAAALVLSACGEQVPGGTIMEGAGSEQQGPQQVGQGRSGGEGISPPATAQPETAEDADDPIVIKIEDDEYRTIMAIYRKYDSTKSGPLNLHAPVSPAEEIGDGWKQEYVSGAVYWSPRTGAQIVRGQILKTYRDNGGEGGTLGWPVGDETTEGGAVYSDFEHGRIKLEDMAIQVIQHGG